LYITTLSIMALSIGTISVEPLRIMTLHNAFSIMTLSIMHSA
jgi:hypothetical protein